MAVVVTSRKRVTITQVAKKAGVAPATVSAILNERDYCYASDETKDRVRTTARDLGYRPNALARGLLGKTTATIGLIMPGFNVEMTSLKISGFEDEARLQKQMTIMACSKNDADLEDQAVRWLMDRCVDAIAAYPTEHGEHLELKKLAASGFPIVTFDGDGRLDFPVDDVTADAYGGGRLQADHLIAIGRRRVCIANNAVRCFVNDEKIRGVCDALADAGCPPPTQMNLDMNQFSPHQWMPGALPQIKRFLRDNADRFDAVAAIGDLPGLSVLSHAVDLGLRVPKDLAVIGFDGIEAGEHGAIPLSTISHDAIEIGRTAFRLLAERLSRQRRNENYRTVRIPMQLAVRRSTVCSPTV